MMTSVRHVYRYVLARHKMFPKAYDVLLTGIVLASVGILAACASATHTGSALSGANGSQVNESPASSVPSSVPSVATSGDGSWRTLSESSISSVSTDGGSSSSDSQSSVSVFGPYRVLAACEGSGALDLTLQPGGAVTVQCANDEGDPSRVAGSDSAPPGAILVLDARPRGNIAAADILVQERE